MHGFSFWFSTIGFLVIGIPLVLIILLMVWVIRKSVVKPAEKVVNDQRNVMMAKIREKQAKLEPWTTQSLEKITNETDYNYSRGIYQKFNGSIRSNDGHKIITFRRIDHGLKIDSKITAATRNHIFYFEASPEKTLIYINGKPLGKLNTNGTILSPQNEKLGHINRDQSPYQFYSVNLNGDEIALIAKNTDRRSLILNQFHDTHSISGLEQYLYWEEEPEFRNQMVKPLRQSTDHEYDWLLALTIYELVTFGIDFTQH